MSRAQFEGIEPTELRWTEGGDMAIVWSDGHRSNFSPEYLRSICPCAECQGTHGTPPKAFNILSASQVARAQAGKETVVLGVAPVGNYAVCFTWGDGHNHGIYSWSYLRAECQAYKKAQSG